MRSGSKYQHRVAITGIGIISTLGNDVDSVAQSLQNGVSGIVVDEERKQRGFRSPLTGIIRDFNPTKIATRKQRKTMTDFCLYAYAASRQAIASSGLDPENFNNDRSGIIFGNDSSCLASINQVNVMNEYKSSYYIDSGFVFKAMTSNITLNLNVVYKTKGVCYTIGSACSSGGHALGQAADLIRLGRQDRIICGAAQEINWESMCSFDALNAFSTRADNPREACRPFDKDRDGLVPSGGGAVVILENYEHARKRNAPIIGEIMGYGFSSDGNNVAVPDENGIARCMQLALDDSGVNVDDIDYICAHATSTPTGDSVEAASVLDVFSGGTQLPWISSTKSMTGHELWMSGAAQVVYTSLMARHGFIAPNINFTQGDEITGKLRIAAEAVPEKPRMVLCNSAGFGGTNSCLVINYEV